MMAHGTGINIILMGLVLILIPSGPVYLYARIPKYNNISTVKPINTTKDRVSIPESTLVGNTEAVLFLSASTTLLTFMVGVTVRVVGEFEDSFDIFQIVYILQQREHFKLLDMAQSERAIYFSKFTVHITFNIRKNLAPNHRELKTI